MTASHRAGLVDRIRGLVDIFWREIAKFGIVGSIGFIIDFGGFNLLYYTPGPLNGHITTAKIASGIAATMFTWMGNRAWTFRHRRSRAAHHEAMLFFLVNSIGLAISAGWLALTHYAFAMDSRLAVNVNTILGIGLATIFRFWAYRQFVFAGEHPGDPEPDELADAARESLHPFHPVPPREPVEAAVVLERAPEDRERRTG